MKKSLCAVVIGSFLTLSSGLAYSQQPESTPLPRGPQGRPGIPAPMPGFQMGRQMQGRMGLGGIAMMLQLLRDDPKLAGMMMQMHGEMMKIRGEEMGKMGDVMRQYGARLEKESTK
jgi:hypothetical protein